MPRSREMRLEKGVDICFPEKNLGVEPIDWTKKHGGLTWLRSRFLSILLRASFSGHCLRNATTIRSARDLTGRPPTEHFVRRPIAQRLALRIPVEFAHFRLGTES